MVKHYFHKKNDSSKSESESSITDRAKERQTHKSKSIKDDPKYKNIVFANPSTIKSKNSEFFQYNPSLLKNASNNSALILLGSGAQNNSNCKLFYYIKHITLISVKNYKIGLEGPQNRINQLADSISFKMRQNNLFGLLKNKNYDKGYESLKKETTQQVFPNSKINFVFSQPNEHLSNKNSSDK